MTSDSCASVGPERRLAAEVRAPQSKRDLHAFQGIPNESVSERWIAQLSPPSRRISGLQTQ